MTPEEWEAWDAAEWAAGRCSASGYTRHACHLGPCDCFDPDTCATCANGDSGASS